MYKWRQVKCPLCEHIFMWRQESYTGSNCDIFKRKGINEKLESASCPKCTFEMVVADDLLEGIDTQNEETERIPAIRGI